MKIIFFLMYILLFTVENAEKNEKRRKNLIKKILAV